MSDIQDLTMVLSAIELTQVRGERRLFSNLSFEVNAGCTLWVRGENGSGKTSLLRTICGLSLPESGQILWNHGNIRELANAYRASLTWVGHLSGVKLDLTPLEHLQFESTRQKHSSGVSLIETLEQIGLQQHTHLPCRFLSQGQLRRVALARLWLSTTPLWILDEPFTALDESGILAVEASIQKHLKQGGVVVIASHRPPDLHPLTVNELVL